MVINEGKHNRNKKAKRLNLPKGSKPHNPSQTNGGAMIQINLDTAIPNLRNVAQKYIGIVNPHGFLTDLREALGIPDASGVSKYGKVTIPKDDGSVLQASLRVTNHQANADKYVEHDTNYEYNLSIVVRRKQRKNTFIPNNNVKLDEFVYYGNNLAKVENPLTQIVNSIIGFLQSGTYKDTTGVAFLNQSPQQQENSENSQEIKENRTMNKKQVIRLTESQFHKIIKECVKRLLNEGKVVNNLKPREGWDYVDDETGEFVSIPEDPFYKEYSSNDARNKRAERKKSRLYKSDSRLWFDGVWENDTIEKALYRLKHHPEMLEISPESMYLGAVQWEGDPTQMDNCRRIAANDMWELWDIEGQPRYILRKDWVKKHEMDVFGEPNEDSYIRSSEKLIDYYK